MPSNIKRNVREKIYARDNYTCQACGVSVHPPLRYSDGKQSPRLATLDHIIPKARGGGNRQSNLQTLCAQCNVAKGDRWVVAEMAEWRPAR